VPLSIDALSEPPIPRHWLVRYALAAGIVAVASLLRLLVDPLIHDQIPYFIYVAAVVVATWFCGAGAGVFGTVLSAFVGNYLFVLPRYEVIPHGEDWIAMALFALVALGLVWQVGRWRRAERVLRGQAHELQAQGQELRIQAQELRAQSEALQAQGRELQAQAERYKALHEEAQRVNRVKDEFLATLSHELRTPLNAVVGWAYMLGGGDLDDGQVADASEAILRNAQAQVRLIEDLLDVSRVISGKLHLRLAPIDMAGVVQSALDAIRPAADAKSVDIRASLLPGANLIGDPDRLRQVAWNLVSNAVKFTPKHGRVEVRLERRDSQIQLTVSDTGIGVEPEFLPHLFERFTQADSSLTRRHGGLGLGLAIVRHISELHGGTVGAESGGKDLGATFSVTLPVRAVTEPVADEAAPCDTERGAADERRPEALEGIRVLVVDDERDARELVQAVLRQYGADVRAVASAEDAFHEVRRWRPDVLVADIGMPDEDGYTFLRRVRALAAAEGGTTPAAALTAYALREDRERALAAGFQEHVAKPVPPARLADVVARLACRPAIHRGN